MNAQNTRTVKINARAHLFAGSVHLATVKYAGETGVWESAQFPKAVTRGRWAAGYGDVAGFCRSATVVEIRGHTCVLTPGRYVGIEAVEEGGEPFEEKMERLTAKLAGQFIQAGRLEDAIAKNLAVLGFDNMG